MSGPKRKTWQQAAVREALDGADGFVSAQQLHSVMREQGSSIGLATVYRALAAMVDANEADTFLSQNGESMFNACDTEHHHHHIICRSCGRTEEIAADVIEDWSRKVAADHGFTEPTHEIDIFGLCQKCQQLESKG